MIRPLLAILLATTATAQRVEFNRDIRPILSEKCFKCHGPDRRKRKGDLRLDTREGAFADLGDYRAIVPGNPEESELYVRITEANAEDRMPPEKSLLQLTPREIELIRRWIEQGATWKSHWSFVPIPADVAVPEVRDEDWPLNPIDLFVLLLRPRRRPSTARRRPSTAPRRQPRSRRLPRLRTSANWRSVLADS